MAGPRLERGDVRWVSFRAPDKRRPVLVLTRTSLTDLVSEISVAPITRRIRNIASEVRLGTEDGMDYECTINLDRIQTIDRNRLGDLITRVSAEQLRETRDAILFAFDL